MTNDDLRAEVLNLSAQVELLLQAVAEMPGVLDSQQSALADEQARRRALRVGVAAIFAAMSRSHPKLVADATAVLQMVEQQFILGHQPEGAVQEIRSLTAAVSDDALRSLFLGNDGSDEGDFARAS